MLPLKPYKVTECDILDAISDRVLQDRDAVEKLTRSLREHCFLRIPQARLETLRWYTVTVITNFVDGGGQSFHTETVKAILRNARLKDLERLRELRKPGECSIQELYLRKRKRAPLRALGSLSETGKGHESPEPKRRSGNCFAAERLCLS